MPGVFSAINTRLQGSLIGKDLKTINKNIPEGIVIDQEGWVESNAVPKTDVYIKGKFDLLVKDPNGNYILIDLKISSPDVGKIDKYKTQLGAYKFALENPKKGKGINISKMGLLIFYPDAVISNKENALLSFPAKWFEVPSDPDGFIKFIINIDKLLKGPKPRESKTCKWCQYRGLDKISTYFGDIPKSENSITEFKSSLRWDFDSNNISSRIENACLKAIAGFLNFNGGKLLIGISPKGEIIGLEKDMNSLRDEDKLELHLNNLIISKIGKEYCQYIYTAFKTIENKLICVVDVYPSQSPAFVKIDHSKVFYVRTGNSTQPYDIDEALRYILRNWPSVSEIQ